MEKKSKRHKKYAENSHISWPVKFGSKLMLGLIVIVIFLSLVRCSIKKPESPQWDTALNVPLINRTYDMPEIIQRIDQEGIELDDNDGVIYNISYDVDTVAIDAAELTAPDLSYSVSEQLGPIDLDPPQIAPVSTAIGDIGPLAAGLPGYVPATSFSLTHDMPAIDNFSSATISSGDMYIVINNQLGVDLTVVDIEIYDQVNAAVVGTASFPGGILNGVTDSVSLPLAGVTLSNQLEIRADCSNAEDTVLSASQQISTDIRFPGGLTVSAATAQVPALNPISFSDQADLGNPGDTRVIHSASLQSGSLNLDITNNTNLAATLSLTLPDVVSKSSGTPLSLQQPISANGNEIVNIDLSAFNLEPQDLTAPQTIDVNVVASVPGSGGTMVAVDQSDDFSISATVTSLQFEEVTGVFDATDASFDPFVEEIDIPEGFDGVGLVSSILTLEVVNNVEVAGNLDLLLSDGAGRTISVSGSVAAGTAAGPEITVFNVVDSGFLNPVPDTVIFSGAVSFGDGMTVSTIGADDWVTAHVTFSAPMEMILTEVTFATDIESENLDPDDMDKIIDHVVEGSLRYYVENHLPLGVEVSFLLGGDTTQFDGDTNHVIPSYSLIGEDAVVIDAAWSDPVTGIVPPDSISATGEQVIYLTSEDVNNILDHETLFIEPVIVLQGSDGQMVKLTANDYLRVYGVVEVVYHFDGEF